MSIGMWVYVWVFDSVPLIHLSIFMSISCGLYYYSFVIELEIRDSDISRSSFTIQDCSSYPVFLFSQMKLSIVLSKYVKNCVGILLGIALNL